MRWMRREKPDVVINLGGAPLHEVLTRGGWRIPQDLGFAWLACPRLGDPLSGIWQNGKLTGAMAVDTLISMVERHERGLPEQATTLMLEGQWNEGRTLRPLSK
jgi:hypothetical protein